MVSKINLSPTMASSIVCLKAVVLLLFIHCLLLLPLFVGVYCYMIVLFCSSFLSFIVLQSSRWGRESLVLWYVLNFVSLVFFGSSWSFIDLKRFIPVHELFHKITEQQYILMFLYRLIGCDTYNAFYGTGKKLAHRVMCKMPKSFNNYVSNLPALNL